MTDLNQAAILLEHLVRAGPTSDTGLESALEISPARVVALTEDLARKGLPLFKDSHARWTTAYPIELLDRARVLGRISKRSSEQLGELRVDWQTGSTNSELMSLEPPAAGMARVYMAEFQSAGRGRRGKTWHAPPTGGLLLSLAWTFASDVSEPAGLTLATGVAVREALRTMGIKQVCLKWPNDLLWDQRKLGGVLVEMRRTQKGAASVVVGIGLNYRLGDQARARVAAAGGADAVDIVEVAGDHAPGRNRLAACLIDQLLDMLVCFESRGLAPFLERWRANDAYRDQAVQVTTPAATLNGIARGVDARGALRLEIDGREQRFISAQVSLRPQ